MLIEEFNSKHPSDINSISRLCMGVEQFCGWYYENRPWYENLYSQHYYKMTEKMQVKPDNAYARIVATNMLINSIQE